MKKLLIALALLFGVALGSPANASSKGYYYNAPNIEVIASAIDASVAKDATGNTLIAPEKCRKDGSCATPAAYLASFQAHDPEAGLTSVSQVAEFMRTRLVKDCSVTGSFQMDSIILTKTDAARADVNGMSRSLKKGECVYVDNVTGRVVLAENCANPVGKRVVKKRVARVVKSPCAMINIPKGAVLAHVAFKDATDKCAATRPASPGSKDDGKGWTWFTPCSACDFSAFVSYTGWQTTPVGKTAIDAVGQQIRVSPDNRTDICFEDADGNVSDTVSVRPEDFKRVAGALQASVGPEFIRYEKR